MQRAAGVKAAAQDQSSTQGKNNGRTSTGTTAKKGKFGDLDKDGDFDFDDVLFFFYRLGTWIISWRTPMVISAISIVCAGYSNGMAWRSVVGNDMGVLVWLGVQCFQLFPVLDSLNPKAAMNAMIRMQRKPIEVPAINDEVNANADRVRENYRKSGNPGRWLDVFRLALYVAEFIVLNSDAKVMGATSIDFGALISLVYSVVGVEASIRSFNFCGWQLMTPDERKFAKKLESTAKNTSVRFGAN